MRASPSTAARQTMSALEMGDLDADAFGQAPVSLRFRHGPLEDRYVDDGVGGPFTKVFDGSYKPDEARFNVTALVPGLTYRAYVMVMTYVGTSPGSAVIYKLMARYPDAPPTLTAAWLA